MFNWLWENFSLNNILCQTYENLTFHDETVFIPSIKMLLVGITFFIITVAVTFDHRSFTHWTRAGFPEIKPLLLLGNLKPVVKGKKSFGVTIYELYRQSRARPFVGFHLFFRSALLINDIDLVKNEPLSDGLFMLSGGEWKNLQTKLTSAFSSAKLKNIFPTFLELHEHIRPTPEVSWKWKICYRASSSILSRVQFSASKSIRSKIRSIRDVGQSFSAPNLINCCRGAGIFLWPK